MAEIARKRQGELSPQHTFKQFARDDQLGVRPVGPWTPLHVPARRRHETVKIARRRSILKEIRWGRGLGLLGAGTSGRPIALPSRRSGSTIGQMGD